MIDTINFITAHRGRSDGHDAIYWLMQATLAQVCGEHEDRDESLAHIDESELSPPFRKILDKAETRETYTDWIAWAGDAGKELRAWHAAML